MDTITTLQRLAPVIYEHVEDDELIDQYTEILDRNDTTTRILDDCRTLYAIWCRDGINNETFNMVLGCMFERLEKLDGIESMMRLMQEAITPPKEVDNG